MTPDDSGNIEILRHWRGHVIVQRGAGCYRIDGEGLADGSWVIYGATSEVERENFDSVICESVPAGLQAELIAMLKRHWDNQGFPYIDDYDA